jgi:hypothetical protein
MVFIWPEAAGTRGALRAALRREVGAGAQGTRGGPEAALSREVETGAAGTRDAPGAALRREACGEASPRAAPSQDAGLDMRRPQSCPEPRGGRRRSGATRRPQSCPEPIYY